MFSGQAYGNGSMGKGWAECTGWDNGFLAH